MPKPKESTVVQTEETVEIFTCECCDPKRNLIPRPDLGGLTADDKHAQIALCVLHRPISVHTWDASGQKYVWRKDLTFKDNQVLDGSGQVFAQSQVTPATVELDTDDEQRNRGGQEPQRTTRVNLEDDGYY